MRDLNDYVDNYIKHDFEDTQVRYRKRNILERIQIHEHRCILEVGCGLEPFFSSYDNFEKLVIIEPSVQFCNNAQDKIANDINLKNRVIVINDYLENSIDAIAWFNFDFIILSCLLPELEDVSLFLDKLHSVMKIHTIVYVNVPNAFSFHRVLATEMGLIKSVFEVSGNNLRFGQGSVYDLASLSELITKHNYKILNTGSYFLKPFTHKQMSGLLENNIIDKTVLDGLYRMTKFMPGFGSEIFMEFKLNA